MHCSGPRSVYKVHAARPSLQAKHPHLVASSLALALLLLRLAFSNGQGRRGSAPLVAGLLLLCLLLPATTNAAAKTYIVGDDAGWSKNLDSWLGGKTFYAGDVLVFKYDKERHDLAMLGGKGYRRCQVPRHSSKSRVMRTGNDVVTLRRGNNYFICGQPGHCKNNMKLAVKAW
ncbi:hypothetical protein ACQ4PT_009262 [Festuca glaucescens]